MNMSNSLRHISTGDYVDNRWVGPEWTPYAQAIADHYPNQVPWFATVQTNFTNVAGERRTSVLAANLYDVLIFGAHVSIGDNNNADNGQTAYLQITDQKSCIPWVVINVLGYAPMTAFGGVRTNLMPNYQFPEAFFLDRGTQLKLDFTNSITSNPAAGGTITLLGVQLTNPGQPQPTHVVMPDGQCIRIGSRMPWLATIGVGGRVFNAAGPSFVLNPGEQSLQFLPGADCPIEIHDIHCNFFARQGGTTTPDNIAVKITDMGAKDHWTPNLSPITGVFGVFTQVYPAMLLNKPYLLKPGHRIQILTQNNTASTDVVDGYVTLRGVRLCDY